MLGYPKICKCLQAYTGITQDNRVKGRPAAPAPFQWNSKLELRGPAGPTRRRPWMPYSESASESVICDLEPSCRFLWHRPSHQQSGECIFCIFCIWLSYLHILHIIVYFLHISAYECTGEILMGSLHIFTFMCIFPSQVCAKNAYFNLHIMVYLPLCIFQYVMHI